MIRETKQAIAIGLLLVLILQPLSLVRGWDGTSEGTIIVQPLPTLEIELLEPQNKSLINLLPIIFKAKVTSNGVPIEKASVAILTSEAVTTQLGPIFSDSSGLVTVTGLNSLTIGMKISWYVEAQKDGYLGAVSEKRILAYSPVLADLVSIATEALESQKKGVLDAATILDNSIPNWPLILFDHALDFIHPIRASGLKKELIEEIVKKATTLTFDKVTPDMKGNLHEMYEKGGLQENITTAEQEIQEIALDSKLLTATTENEFIKDVLTYFKYISKTGAEYDSQMKDIVDAHNNIRVLKQIAFYGVGLIITIATVGLSAPAILVIDTIEAGAGTVLDIYDEANYQKALLDMSANQVFSAKTYRDDIISAFLYLRYKAYVEETLPKLSIPVPSIGKIVLPRFDPQGNLRFSIDNNYEKSIKATAVISAQATIPELLYKEQTYVVPWITYSYAKEIEIAADSQEGIYVESNIQNWLDEVTTKLDGQKFTINYAAEVKVFYGEDKSIALKEEWFSASYVQDHTKKEPWWTTGGTRTAITLYEIEHKLYLHVYDEYGRHVGFNHTSGIVEIDIPDATYEDQQCRIIITLPSNVTTFRYVVDAIDAQSHQERYEVTVAGIERNEITMDTIQSGNVEKNEVQEHTTEISPSGDRIWVDKPSWSTTLNRLLWNVPIVGDLSRFLDTFIPGFGSLLFILLLIMCAFIFVITMKRRKIRS